MKKKLMLCNAIIVLVGFAAATLLVALQVQAQYKKEFSKRLDTALSILSSDTAKLTQDPDDTATNISRRLAEAGQPMRISIIDRSGMVLGDSVPEEVNQNHLDRPEIRQALKTGRGYDTRQSASVGQCYYYEAIYLPEGLFIRAALPTTDLDSVICRLWLIAALGMFFGTVLVILVTGFAVARFTEPLRRLTDTARRISAGEYSSRVVGEYRDEVGEMARSFNLMAENTETAVRELTQKQNQLEGLLQGMADGVLAVGGENEILFLNESARRLLQTGGLQNGGKLEGSLLINRITNLLENAIKCGEPIRESVTASDDRHFLIYVAPLAGPGPSALAVITDVTRMRRLEQMRSEFVANVTHELKTPLTSIRGSIELLKSADRDEKTRLYFYDILDIEAERLYHLIEDMLVLSQIENTKNNPGNYSLNVEKALQSCVKRLAPVAEKSGVSLSVSADPALFVSCPQTRFEQLFCNLIENGIKYNKPDGTVSVTAQKQRKTALVRIKDTGIGIAPEHIPRLFERFYRVDTSRSREIGGTGLGLSIVKHLAALYGGEVSVESEPGVGSTFSVWLPLSPQEPRPRQED